MPYHDKQHLSDLLHLLQQYGLQEAVICPGSRSAPLTLAFARQSQIRTSTAVDERAAAYIALGKSLASQQATALICTSGTALLNFAPAVAEAFYLRIPMLVLSADRPAAWVDQLDGQTIRQDQILAKHTVFSATLPERGDTDLDRWHAARLVQEAWHKAHQLRGPVHLNIPLREPLYEALPSSNDLPKALQWQAPLPQTQLPTALRERWLQAKSILLVGGQQAPNAALQAVINQVIKDPRVVLLSEPVNNLQGGIQQHEAICTTKPAHLQADLLVSWGEQVVAKQLKIWLRSYPAAEHWRIDADAQLADPFRQLQLLVGVTPLEFFTSAAELPMGSGDYRLHWKQAEAAIHHKIQPFFKDLVFGDLYVMAQIAKHLGPNDALQLGNSTPIRYWQLLPQPAALAWLHANRGTSGIDGVNSTALGFASKVQNATWLVTGDLSFVYDLNAFSSSDRPSNLKIIVINNGGGDIFRLIDGPSTQPERETFFATPRTIDLQALAKGWGLTSYLATDALSLQQGLAQLRKSTECCVLEVQTEPLTNQSVYKAYQQLIKSNA